MRLAACPGVVYSSSYFPYDDSPLPGPTPSSKRQIDSNGAKPAYSIAGGLEGIDFVGLGWIMWTRIDI